MLSWGVKLVSSECSLFCVFPFFLILFYFISLDRWVGIDRHDQVSDPKKVSEINIPRS